MKNKWKRYHFIMMFGNLSVYLSCCGYTRNSSLESTSKFWYKGSLKIPKRKYEVVNLRRADITKTKRQNDKTTNNDLQYSTQKNERLSILKPVVSSVTPEGWEVPAPLVIPVVLLLKDTNITWCRNRAGHQYALINTNNINKTLTPSTTQMGARTNWASFSLENRSRQQTT